MREVDRLRADRAALAAAAPAATALFGALWQGEDSDWAVLAHYMRWVVEFRGVCVRHGLSARALEAASRPAPDVSAVVALRAAARAAEAELAALRQAVGWPADYLAGAPLAEIAGRTAALRDAAAEGPRWAAYAAARRPVEQGIARSLLPAAEAGALAMGDLARHSSARSGSSGSPAR
jgi:hypothetical protein